MDERKRFWLWPDHSGALTVEHKPRPNGEHISVGVINSGDVILRHEEFVKVLDALYWVRVKDKAPIIEQAIQILEAANG